MKVEFGGVSIQFKASDAISTPASAEWKSVRVRHAKVKGLTMELGELGRLAKVSTLHECEVEWEESMDGQEKRNIHIIHRISITREDGVPQFLFDEAQVARVTKASGPGWVELFIEELDVRIDNGSQPTMTGYFTANASIPDEAVAYRKKQIEITAENADGMIRFEYTGKKNAGFIQCAELSSLDFAADKDGQSLLAMELTHAEGNLLQLTVCSAGQFPLPLEGYLIHQAEITEAEASVAFGDWTTLKLLRASGKIWLRGNGSPTLHEGSLMAAEDHTIQVEWGTSAKDAPIPPRISFRFPDMACLKG